MDGLSETFSQSFPKRLLLTRDFPALFKSGCWSAQLGDVCAVVLMVKNLPPNAEDVWMRVQSLGREDLPEKGMATHSSILAWRTPWTEEFGGLQSRGLHIAGHD